MYYYIYFDLEKINLASFNYNIRPTISKDKILLQRFSNSMNTFGNFPEKSFLVTDNDESLHRFASENLPLPVIAWSHKENVSESLMGAKWMVLSLDALTEEYLEEIHCRFHGIPLKILETERSYLRELTMNDLENVLSLDKEQDPQSLGRFFRNVMPGDEYSYLEDYIKTQYPFYGYGIYGAFLKNNDEFIGIMGFSDTEEEIELGYAVRKKYQRQGFAKEWGQALIPYAKDQWEFNQIIARIKPGHTASIKTAQACGVIVKSEKHQD